VGIKMSEEIPLSGGKITKGVVKKDNYVLRPCCPNSPFVHNVLKWLELKECSISPRFIGLDNTGREIITYLEGTVPNNLGFFNNNQLVEAGKIIKKLHTILSDFPNCLSGQTVCHNDLSPCNFIFKNELPYAVFDWDAAEINDPLNDVAYAVWMWCDIGNNYNSPNDVGNKINIMLDSYELCKKERSKLIIKIHEQMQRVANSSLSESMIECNQWANDCDKWLYKYQNQIIPLYI
jgi:aminoglycoside phosphotransferase (APT) family kinase protein